MNLPNCERCKKKESNHKCLTCNKFLCDEDIIICLNNLHTTKKLQLNTPPVIQALKILKDSMSNSINDLETSLNNLIIELINQKNKAFEEILEYFNQIEKLESNLLQNQLKDYDSKSMLFELLYIHHDSAESKIGKLFSYNLNFTDISKNSLPTKFFTFDLVKLFQQEKISIPDNTQMPNIKSLLQDSISKAEKMNLKIKDFKDFLAMNRNLKDLQSKLPLNKLESFTFRSKLKKYQFQTSDCPNNETIKAQTNLLPLFENLQKLKIQFLNPEQSEPLFLSLHQISTLKKFSMERCVDLRLTDFKNLSKFLHLIKLTKFKMASCDSLSTGINLLVSNLSAEELKQLIIPGNLIGFEGCNALVDPLKRFKQLRQLNIRNNDINPAGAKVLAQGLLTLEFLEYFDVASNSLRVKGLEEVFKGLKNSKLLKYIDFCCNGLPDDDEEQVNQMYFDGLQGFKAMQTVVLDMTISRITVSNLRKILPDFCSIFVSNSDEILPLSKNLR
jgi:hypothetical protein